MNLNETLCYLHNQLEQPDSPFEVEEMTILKKGFALMEADVRMLESNEPVLRNNDPMSVVLIKSNLFVLIRKLLNDSLTQQVTDFISIFSQLVFNWNKNISKLNEVELLARLVHRYAESVAQIKTTISVMKKANSAYQDLKAWMPPAFDISKEYLEELLVKSFN
jgi:hypothetical protein